MYINFKKRKRYGTRCLRRLELGYQVWHWLVGRPSSLWISSLHRGNITGSPQGVAEPVRKQSCEGLCSRTGLSSLLWLLERLDWPRPLGQLRPCCYLGEPRRARKGFGSRGLLPVSFYFKPPSRPATLLRAWSLLEKRIFPHLLWVRYPLEQSHCSFQGEPTRSQGHPGSFRTCPVPEPKERGWRKSPDVVTRP